MKQIFYIILFFQFCNISSQELTFSKSMKGTGDDRVFKSVIDKHNNLYQVGYFNGTISAELNYTSFGGYDIFVTKYSSDGTLLWFKQIGGSLDDIVDALTLSADGSQLIIAGGYYSNTCNFGDGFSLPNLDTNTSDAFFSILNTSNGSIINAQRYLYGAGSQRPQDIKLDLNNNLIIIGFIQGNLNVSSINGTATTLTCDGPQNYYILQLNANLDFNWVKQFTGNDGNNKLFALDIDNTGYYIAGINKNTLNLDIETLNSQSGSSDIFLYKTDFNGIGQWIRKIKGSNNDVSVFSTCDQQGHVYISGYYASADLKVDSTATLQSVRTIPNKGSNDIFFAKYTTDGTLQWFDVAGSAGDDRLTRLSTDGENIVIAGQFGGPMTFNNETLTPEGSTDGLGIVHDKNDNLLYAIKMGGTGADVAQSCVIDSEGNYIFTGNFYSPTIKFDSNPANNLTNATPSTRDVFIAKYKSRSISFVLDTVKCYGASNGSITANPKGAWAGDLTYAWTKDGDAAFTANTRSIENITAGTYHCTVSSGLYSETATVTMVEPAALTATENLASHKNAVCYGSADGALALTVSGGTGTKSYLWTGNGTGLIAVNASQNAVSAGTYSVTVTDKKGCSVTVNDMVVTEPPKIHFKGTVVTPINGASGKVNLIVIGAVIPFTASWTGAGTFTQVNEDIEAISVAGNYSVQITDNNNCKADTTVLIVDSHNLYAFVSEKKNVSCKGGNNGSITVTPQTDNASPSFSYAWSGPAGPYPSQPTITGVAGTYSVIITDNNTSPVETYTISDITIAEPAAVLAATITGGNVTCFGQNNGYADANGTGGTLPYTYQWKKNGESITEVAEVITSLGAGNYDVTITDAGNCTATASVALSTPPPIFVNSALVTPVTCNGTKNDGAISLNVDGGTGTLTYRWSNGLTGQTISLLSAGTYRCTITDINNCSTVTGQTVGQPSVMTASFANTNVSCFGGSNGAVDLTPAGGNTGAYTFKWNNNQVTEDISGLNAGTYSVVVTDSKNCEKSFTTTLTQPAAALDVTSVSVTNANCNGSATGSITVSSSGGTSPYLWTWSNSRTGATNSGLVAGDYTVTVTDSKNCTKDATYTITEPTALTISEVTAAHVDLTCNGIATGALEITASGSTGTYEYSLAGTAWQSSPVFSNLDAGNYSVMVRDQSVTSCQKTIGAPIVVSQPAALVFSSPAATNITCNGLTNGTVSAAATGGTGSLLYTLKLDGTASSNVSGASTGLFTGLSSGTAYTVEVADANNCKLTSNTYSISEPQAIILASAVATNITCSGLTNGTVTAQASGGTGTLGYKLLLNDAETGNTTGASSGSFSGVSEGATYKVQVTDANSCGPVMSSVLSITAPQPITAGTVTATNITCSGLTNGKVDILAAGGTGAYSFKLLLNGTPSANVTGASSGNFTGLTAGTGYAVEINDANNCGPVVSNSVNIQEPSLISIVSQTATGTSGSAVSDGSINIIATGGTGTLSFLLNTGTTQSSGTFAGLAVGTYTVTISDANSCGPVSSNSLVVSAPTSVGNLAGAKIRLYPNPVSERVFVEVKNQEFKELKVELKNISGQASLTQKYENVSDGFVADIDLFQLPKGIYVILVNNTVMKDKLIVQ